MDENIYGNEEEQSIATILRNMTGITALTAISTAVYGSVLTSVRQIGKIVKYQKELYDIARETGENLFDLTVARDIINIFEGFRTPMPGRIRSGFSFSPSSNMSYYNYLQETLAKQADETKPALDSIIRDRLRKPLNQIAVSKVIGRQEELARKLEKDYPNILGVLTDTIEKSGSTSVTIQSIVRRNDLDGDNYIVRLTDRETKRTMAIKLPVLRNGIIRWKGAQYVISYSGYQGILPSGEQVVYATTTGDRIIRQIETALNYSNIKSGQTGIFNTLPDLIERAVDVNISREGGYALTQTSPLQSTILRLEDLEKIIHGKVDVYRKNALLQAPAIYGNMRVVRKINNQLEDLGRISITTSSDATMVQKGSVRVVKDPLLSTIRAQVNPVRMAILAGKTSHTPLSERDILKTFGILSKREFDTFLDAEVTQYPAGRMAKVSLYFGDGLPFVGEGNMVGIVGSEVKKDEIIKQFKAFNGKVQKSYSVFADKRTLQRIKTVTQSEHPILRSGFVLGLDMNGSKVMIPEKGKIINITQRGNIAKITLEHDIPFSAGTKMASGKVVVSNILTPPELTRMASIRTSNFDIYSAFVEAIRRAPANDPVEFIINGELGLKRFGHGMLGRSVIQRTLGFIGDSLIREYERTKGLVLNDIVPESVEKDIKNKTIQFIKGAFGAGAEAAISDVKVINTKGDVGLVIDTTRSDMFDLATKQIENAIYRAASTKDIGDLLHVTRKMQDSLKKIGIKHKIKLVGNVKRYMFSEELPKELAPMKVPIFMLNQNQLINIAVDLPMFTHISSADITQNVASTNRSLSGFIGGARLGLDHLRNAEMMGLRGLSSWILRLMEYNYPYLAENAIAALVSPLMHDIPITGEQTPFTIGKKQYVAVDLGNRFVSPDTTMGRFLVKNYEEQAALAATARVRMISKPTLYPSLAHDFPELFEGYQSISDLTSQGVLGLKANSVSLIDEDLKVLLMRTINSVEPGKVPFMKLPIPIKMGEDTTITHIPLTKLAEEDLFALDTIANDVTNPASKISKIYYTGPENVSSMFNMLMSTAKYIDHIREEKKLDQTKESLNTKPFEEYRRSVINYLKTLTDIAGKHNPFVRRLTTFEAPFTYGANLAQLDILGYGEVGIHEDALSKMLTNNSTMTRTKLRSYARKYKETKEITDTIGAYIQTDERIRIASQELKSTKPKFEEAKAKFEKSFLGSIKYENFGVKIAETERLVDRARVDNLINFLTKINPSRVPHDIKKAIEEIFPVQLGSGIKGTIQSVLNPGIKFKDLRGKINALNTKLKLYTTVHEKKGESLFVYNIIDKLISEIEGGVSVLPVRAQGYPELSFLSGLPAHIRVLPEDKFKQIFDKGLSKYSGDTDNIRSMIFTSKATAEAIGRDFDKDFLSIMMQSFGQLTKNITDVTRKTELYKKFSANKNIARKMSADTIGTEAVSALVAADKVTLEGDNEAFVYHFGEPASLQSNYMMEALSEYGEHDFVVGRQIVKYIKDRAIEEGIPITEVNSFIQEAMKTVRRGVSEIYPATLNYSNLYVMFDPKSQMGMKYLKMAEDEEKELRNVDAKERKYKTIKMRLEDVRTRKKSIDSLEKRWELLSEKAKDDIVPTLSEDAYRVRDALAQNLKESYKKYIDITTREGDERIALIKILTPEAYNLRASLLELSSTLMNSKYGMRSRPSVNEFKRSKVMNQLVEFADKIVAQNTISSKHGNPNVLDDIRKSIRAIIVPQSSPEDIRTEVEKLSSGDFTLSLGDEESKLVKSYGYDPASMTVSQYSEYIAMRNSMLTTLDAEYKKIIAETTKTVTGSNNAKAKHAEKLFVEKVLNQSIIAPSSRYYGKLIRDLDPEEQKAITRAWSIVNPVVLDEELNLVKKSDKKVQSFVMSYLSTINNEMAMSESFNMINWEETSSINRLSTLMNYFKKKKNDFVSAVGGLGKVYERSTGSSIFERGSERYATMFSSQNMPESIASSLNEKVEQLTQKATEENKIIPNALNIVDRLLYRLASSITGIANVTVGGYMRRKGSAVVSDLDRSIIKMERSAVGAMMNKEISAFDIPLSSHVAEESYSYLRKTIVNTGGHAKAIKGIKNVIFALGFVGGSAIAQSVSKALYGYSVPGLSYQQGLGGEYGERGIMGKIPEAIIPERPVHVAAWDEVEKNSLKELDFIEANGLFMLEGQKRLSSQRVQQVKNRYKGVII